MQITQKQLDQYLSWRGPAYARMLVYEDCLLACKNTKRWLDTASDIFSVGTIGVGGSAILGMPAWQYVSKDVFVVISSVFAFIACVLSIVKPRLKYVEDIERYQELMHIYTRIDHEFKKLEDKMFETGTATTSPKDFMYEALNIRNLSDQVIKDPQGKATNIEDKDIEDKICKPQYQRRMKDKEAKIRDLNANAPQGLEDYEKSYIQKAQGM